MVATTGVATITVRLSRLVYDYFNATHFEERRHEYVADGQANYVELADAWGEPTRTSKRFVWFDMTPAGAEALYGEMDWEREQLSWESQEGDIYEGARPVLAALRRWTKTFANLEGRPPSWKS